MSINHSAPERITVVNIISTSYSGSTWLNSLLGAHPQMFSVGAVDRLRDGQRPVCSLHGPDCPFWSRLDVAASENIYLRIAQLCGKSFLVVSNPRYMLPAQDDPRIESRFILLIRDGRAVVASDRRKHPHKSTWAAARSWSRGIRKKQRLVQRRDSATVFTARYEEQRDNTHAELHRICEFLKLPFDPRMLESWQHVDHYLGGNGGSLTHAAAAHGLKAIYGQNKEGDIVTVDLAKDAVQFASGGHSERVDLSIYKSQGPAGFRDERWRREFTNWQLRIFALAAGRTNRRFGYPAAFETPNATAP